MKLTLPALAFSITLPCALALTVPPTVNITTNVTTTPPTVNITTNVTTTPPTVNITTNVTTTPPTVNITTNVTTTPPSTVNLTTNGTITPPSRYYLQTRVKGYGNEDKNGLYVSSYHTGAGESDATLEPIGAASVGFLNGTYQQFDFGTSFPWGMVMGVYDSYAEWEFTTIDVGYGSAGFFFNETGLQFDPEESDFHGWLACDWFHGVPQLFWEFLYDGEPLPSSCAPVDLLPVAV